MCHHDQLIFVFLLEAEFRYVDQADLEFLISSNLFSSASQSAVITGVSHHAQPFMILNTSYILSQMQAIFPSVTECRWQIPTIFYLTCKK